MLALPMSSSSRPQTQQKASLPTAVPSFSIATTRQVGDVRVIRKQLRNILLRLNSPDHDQAITTLRHRLRYHLCALTLALRPDDRRLPLLLRLLDDESCSLGLLLRDLLLFYSLGELPPESHVCDADIFERNVELAGAFEEVGADAVADGFTLGDQFGGIELRNDGFEDFVADGGENTLVVVLA